MSRGVFPKRLIPLLVKQFDAIVEFPKRRKYRWLLNAIATARAQPFFIEIGSNDGVVHDPIFRHVLDNNWRGILVEPVAYYFEKLTRNYRSNSNLVFENIAISNREETRDFFRVQEGLSFMPNWCDGLGSFYLDVLLKHRWIIPNLADHIIKETVQCMSFEALLEKHRVDSIDLLMIDTEGYDYEIIKQIDFAKTIPHVIIYEHKHLPKSDRRECEALLRAEHYTVRKDIANTLAVAAVRS